MNILDVSNGHQRKEKERLKYMIIVIIIKRKMQAAVTPTYPLDRAQNPSKATPATPKPSILSNMMMTT